MKLIGTVIGIDIGMTNESDFKMDTDTKPTTTEKKKQIFRHLLNKQRLIPPAPAPAPAPPAPPPPTTTTIKPVQ